jgi:hypothetical protein
MTRGIVAMGVPRTIGRMPGAMRAPGDDDIVKALGNMLKGVEVFQATMLASRRTQ